MSKPANTLAVKAALISEVQKAAASLGKSPASILNWIKDDLLEMPSSKWGVCSMGIIQSLNAKVFPVHVADEFEAHLNPLGRLHLLGLGLLITPTDEALTLVDAFMAYHATGYPMPSLTAVMEDARWHADSASPQERKAYALAHYQAMPVAAQMNFLDFVKKGTVA